MMHPRSTYLATHTALEIIETTLYMIVVTALAAWIVGMSEWTSIILLFSCLFIASFALKCAENNFDRTEPQRELLEGAHGFFILACGWTLPAAAIVWLGEIGSLEARLAILFTPIVIPIVIMAGLYAVLFISFQFWKRRLPKKRKLGNLMRRGFGRAQK